MPNVIRLFYKSKAFLISLVAILIYAIFFHNQILLDKTNLEYAFYLFLALFPLVLSVFAILISFTDIDFLKFLHKGKLGDNKTPIYDGIVFYFKINSILIFIAIIWISVILWFGLWDLTIQEFAIFQYPTFFILTYTIVSFIEIIRFIFYYANSL